MDERVVERLFYSLLITSLLILFLGLVLRIEKIYPLDPFSSIFIYSSLALLFITYVFGLVYLAKIYLPSIPKYQM